MKGKKKREIGEWSKGRKAGRDEKKVVKCDIRGFNESSSCLSQISFNCTLIAHENVTTEFFGVILFYSILF